MLCNLALFAAKCAVGAALHSVAVIADAVNNLYDAVSSVILWVGFRMAARPADREHPYGHGRAEYVATLCIAIVMLVLALEFLKTSVEKILSPEPMAFSAVGAVILACAIPVKLGLALYNRRMGVKIQSQTLEAAGADAGNDALVTAVTLAALLLSRFTGLALDGWAGFAVSFFLFRTGFLIARQTVSQLMGEPPDPALAEGIRRAVERCEGVLRSHDLEVHNYGVNRSMATIHAEFPDTMSLAQCHSIVDRAEREIGRAWGLRLIIHVDPVDIHDRRLEALTAAAEEFLQARNLPGAAHDFQLGREGEKKVFRFDLALPYAWPDRAEAQFLEELQAALAAQSPETEVIIHAERGGGGMPQA